MKICFKKGFPYKRKIAKIFDKALIVTGNDLPDLFVGLCLVSEQQIRALNDSYRHVDRVTDVLSFPFLQTDYKQNKLVDFENEREPDGRLYLGDIYICETVAAQQAKKYGHSLKRETCFLALHGLLHLLGYDHIEKEDEVVMQSIAEQILQENGIKRGKKHD